jgi:S-adenosylmethionine uptake transporter
MVLFAATCWAGSIILVRVVNRSETTTNQMLISNAIFALACAISLPVLWRTPDAAGLALMILLGLAGGFGQFLLFESFRHAPASAIAPIEYTALVWAFLLGWLIWADIPPTQVFIGAALIVGSCLGLVWSESRKGARDRPS